jgi:hypothetical protein
MVTCSICGVASVKFDFTDEFSWRGDLRLMRWQQIVSDSEEWACPQCIAGRHQVGQIKKPAAEPKQQKKK